MSDLTPEEVQVRDQLMEILRSPDATDDQKARATEGAQQLKDRVDQRAEQEFVQRIKVEPREADFVTLAEEYKAQAGRLTRGATSLDTKQMERYNDAARRGIDIRTGAPSRVRLLGALSDYSPSAKYQIVDAAVREDLFAAGVKVPDSVPVIQTDGSTGELMYLRANEQGEVIPTLLNGKGTDLGDFAAALPSITQVAAETTGALVGAAAGAAATFGGPMTILAAGVGAGTAAAGTMALRRGVLIRMGVDPELVNRATTAKVPEAIRDGMFWELALPGMAAAGRGLKNKARFIEPEDLPEIESIFAETQQATKRMKDETGVELSLTPAELTRDPAQAVSEKAVRSRAAGSSAIELSINDQQNRQQLVKALDRLHTGGKPDRGIIDVAFDADGRPIPRASEEATDFLRQPLDSAEDHIKFLDEQVAEIRAEFGQNQRRQVYPGIQRTLKEGHKRAWEHQAKAWDDFRSISKGIHVANGQGSPIRKFFESLDADAQKALSSEYADAKRELMKKKGFGDVEGEPQGLNMDTLDMEQLHIVLSHLKHQSRKIANATHDAPKYSARDVRGLVSAIHEQINTGTLVNSQTGRALGGPKGSSKFTRAIRDQWHDANQATFDMYDLYDNEAVDLLTKTNSKDRFVANPALIDDTIFKPRNTEALDQVLHAVQGDPDVKLALINTISDKYRREVFDVDGQFNLAKHELFLDNYEDHLHGLLGKNATDSMDTLGSLGRAKQIAEAERDVIKRTLEHNYGRRILRREASGGNIADTLLSSNMPIENIRNIMKELPPELADRVRQEGMASLNFRLLKSAGTEVNKRTVDQLLNKYGRQLGAMYGPEYVRNLQAMSRVMAGMETAKRAVAPRLEQQPVWLFATRSILGPLNVWQRRITALHKGVAAQKRAAEANILLNPSHLQEWVKLGKMKSTEIAFWNTMGRLVGDENMKAIIGSSPKAKEDYATARWHEQQAGRARQQRKQRMGEAKTDPRTAMEKERARRGL